MVRILGIGTLALLSVVSATGTSALTQATSAEIPVKRHTVPISLEGLNDSPIVQAAVTARVQEIDKHNRQVWLNAQALIRRQEAAKVAAARRSVVQSVSPNRRPGRVNWDGIARCETGGNWSMQGRTFSGGLGFANTTWDGFGGREFASNAGLATREQQIVVAERVYAKYGLSGWGCKAYG